MEFLGDSLDDILIDLYKALPRDGKLNIGTRGKTLELIGVAFHVRNPRARLSRSENRGKLFSALGELLWYLSGSKELSFIKEYIPAYKEDAEIDGTINGAYGPRLLAMRGEVNQINSITEILKKKPGTRRAVIQLFNAEDIKVNYKEVPCTTAIQFFLRDGRLHMAVTLRSNDAYKGLPHDVFCFTMLQEMMACRLEAEVGEYYQFVGSMHVYVDDLVKLKEYVHEGHQKLSEMPAMPAGDPFELVPRLLECERRMREGVSFDASTAFNEPYWADIVRLLQGFWAKGRKKLLDELVGQLTYQVYRPYLEARRTPPYR